MTAVSPDLRSWIAENLVMGSPPADLQAILGRLGIPPQAAAEEINHAMNHPYLMAARKMYGKVQKRESLLKTLDMQMRHRRDYLYVKREPLPPYADFLRDYYYPNRLGFFAGGTQGWAANDWTPRKLLEKAGADTPVQIQYGRDTDQHYESNSHQHRKEMPFGEFIAMLENSGPTNNFYMTANNNAFANSNLKRLLPDIGPVGDGYLDADSTEGRMFLWVGPGGTVTPMHHDLTNNWFVQLYGTKKFRIIPAMQAPYVYNNLHVFTDIDMLKPDLERYPEFARSTVIEITVRPGDSLFLPIGWWHHVVAESTSISVSFTNFRAMNEMVDYPMNAPRY